MDLEKLIRSQYTFAISEEIINALKNHNCLSFLEKNIDDEIEALQDEIDEWEDEAESQEEIAIEYKDKCKELQKKIKELMEAK